MQEVLVRNFVKNTEEYRCVRSYKSIYLLMINKQLIGSVVVFAGDLSDAQIRVEAMSQGWTVCDGTSLKMMEYPALYGVIGVKYNQSGDGPGTFRVPDYRGQAINGLPVAYLIRYM